LFEGTGNVVQESANLFWDNTNARLAVGTSTQAYTLAVGGKLRISSASYWVDSGANALQVDGTSSFSDNVTLLGTKAIQFGTSATQIGGGASGPLTLRAGSGSTQVSLFSTGNLAINTTTDAGYKLDVNGTTRLNGNVAIGTTTQTGINYPILGKVRIAPISNPYFAGLTTHNFEVWSTSYFEETIFTKSGKGFGTSATSLMYYSGNNVYFRLNNGSQDVVNINEAGMLVSLENLGTPTASAILEAKSTTKGFLPPRMTTTQKNAIASPATGLMVYDTTLNLISVYNGTTWITL